VKYARERVKSGRIPAALRAPLSGVVTVMRGFVVLAVAGVLAGGVARSEENVPDLKDPKMIETGHDL
jgi:hypothetical protein